MSKFTWMIAGLVAVVIGTIIYNKVLFPKEKKGGGMGAKPKEISADGFIIKSQSLQQKIKVTGTFIPSEAINIQSEISGKITFLNLQEGSYVSKGTLLVKLYDADLQAQLSKLKIQEDISQKSENRLAQLLSKNAVSQQDYDAAILQLNSIKADIQILQSQISKTEIRAPFSGMLGLKSVSLGAYISPANVLATLSQNDPIKIDLAVPEQFASSFKKGDKFSFDTEEVNGKLLATIYAVDPSIDENTRNMKLRATLANVGMKLKPGSFVKVDLGIKNDNNTIMIPTQAVVPEARNKKVIVFENGKAIFKIITTGVRTDSTVQVLDGLKFGDTIITSALMYIRPEMDIKLNVVK
jgi:membrane fusion protein (multidrug efflux system)